MAKVYKAETVGPFTAEEFKAIEEKCCGPKTWSDPSMAKEERQKLREEMDEAWEKVHAFSLMAAREGLSGGSYKGMLISFPVADGKAFYVVIDDRRGVKLGHVDWCDAYMADPIIERGIRKSDLKDFAERAVWWEDSKAKRSKEKASG